MSSMEGLGGSLRASDALEGGAAAAPAGAAGGWRTRCRAAAAGLLRLLRRPKEEAPTEGMNGGINPLVKCALRG